MAEKVETVDRSGHVIPGVRINGRLLPSFDIDSLLHVTSIKARPDDILLCTYPKSGTHWVHEIMRFLRAGTTDLPLKEKDDTFIEHCSPSIFDELPSPRMVNTHFHFDMISPDFLRQKCKIVYVTRDPRDIAVSKFKHASEMPRNPYQGKWEDYFQLLLEGKVSYESWFKYTKGFEEGMKQHPDHPFLVLAYEALKDNPLKEVKRIAEFLEVKSSDEFLQQVVDKTSFDSMKKQRQAVETHRLTYLYRKGQKGDWKNYFTVAQSEMFNEKFEAEMPGTAAYKLYTHSS